MELRGSQRALHELCQQERQGDLVFGPEGTARLSGALHSPSDVEVENKQQREDIVLEEVGGAKRLRLRQ